MKKRLILLLALPLALLLFLGTFLWYLPWESALGYGLMEAENVAASRGVALTCDSHSAEDHLQPLFRCGGLRVRHPLGGIELIRASARFRPLASVLNRSVVLDVTMGPGRFETMTGQSMAWDEGRCSLKLRPDHIEIDGLNMKGSLSAKGSLAISPGRSRITRAMVDIKTPAEADAMMQALTAFLPLKRVKSGEWRLERK